MPSSSARDKARHEYSEDGLFSATVLPAPGAGDRLTLPVVLDDPHTVTSRARERCAGGAAIVARIPQAAAAREMAAELQSRVSAFEQLSDESRADVVKGLQRSNRRWSRFVSTGAAPLDSDFDPLREWTR